MAIIIVILFVVGAALFLSNIDTENYERGGDGCDLHDWAWEEKINHKGVFMIICKKCRRRPSL